MDQLAALRLFIKIAQLKSISAAGRALGLSTTAASKQLQDLETALRVKLVDRTTRQLALTESGQRLLQRTVDLLGELDTALAEARELQDTAMGTLRIVARRSFGMLHIAPALPSFRTCYPLVALDLTLTEETELAPGRGIDIVIRLGAPDDKTVIAHRLTSARRVLCASPVYLARAGIPATPAELVRHDCLTYRRAAEPAIWGFRDASGAVTVRVTGPLQSNSGELLRAAANDGLGLVLLPDWIVAGDVASGRLQSCLDSYEAYAPLYREPIYAVHRRGAVPAKVSASIAHLREAMAVTEPFPRNSGK